MNLIIGGFKFSNRDPDEDLPHIVHEVMCVKCYKRWIAVHPELTLLKDLECPQCHNRGYVIATGQLFADDEEVEE